MKFIKVLTTVLGFLIIIAGLFLLLLYSSQYTPEKITDINSRYSEKPPYLLPAKTTYDIVSWNIGAAVASDECDFVFEGGAMTRPDKRLVDTTLSAIKDYLKNFIDLDFLLLQEVDINSKRSHEINQAREINAIFPKHSFSFALNHNVQYIPVPFFKTYGKIMSGIETISSSYPLESVRYGFNKETSFLRSLFAQNNCCIINDYRLRNGKTLVIINVYNGNFALKENNDNLIQSLIALMVTEYEQGNYVISGGDWNINPSNFSDTVFASGDKAFFEERLPLLEYLPEGWNLYYDEMTPTTRSLNAPYQKGESATTITDFFIVSPNIQATKTETISLGFQYSAHNPVFLKFKLN
ncbi:MAG: hypothetical protein LBH92_00750 [Bacteroidales bacterium]|jgi:hypothetical protein|nr:hypothetical protein [Bacteroidales bacterium]